MASSTENEEEMGKVVYARKLDLPDTDLSWMYSEAEDSLEKLNLNAAEEGFRRVLDGADASNADNGELVLGSLVGLADVYIKRARVARYNVPEWYRMMLHAAMYHYETKEVVAFLRRDDHLQPRTRKKIEKIASQADIQFKVVLNVMMETLPRHISEVTRRMRRKQQISERTSEWLTSLLGYCSKQQNSQVVKAESKQKVTVVTEDKVNSEQSSPPAKRLSRKINFDKVHNAIFGLVKQITHDLRRRHYKAMQNEDVLRRSMSLEMINQLSHSSSGELLSLFEDAVIFENAEADSSVPMCESVLHSQELPQTESSNFQMSTRSNLDQSDMSVSEIEYPGNSVIYAGEHMSVDQNSCTNSVEEISVLRHWKSDKSNQMKESLCNVYRLGTFEEFSPLTEVSHFSAIAQNKPHRDCKLFDKEILTGGLKLTNTFATIVCKTADLLHKEENWQEAVDLYIFSLGLFESLPVEVVDLCSVAGVLKNLGVINCKKQNFESGIKLMEEAMELYGGEDHDCVQVADVLLAMGKCYLIDSTDDSPLFTHVMQLVKHHVENDVKPNDIHPESRDFDSDSESEDLDFETSHCVNILDAKSCFTQALNMLRRLEDGVESHMDLYIEALVIFGDCCILTGHHDVAVTSYEEALTMFPHISGTKSVLSNAHVLSMLGTANFLLGNYTKAASTYETASLLHGHLSDGEEDVSIESAFTLTMLGITVHKTKLYHSCVGWCYKASNQYKFLYKDHPIFAPQLHLWFICQNLFNLGFAFSSVDMNDKALMFYEDARELIELPGQKDIIQLVTVLKCTGDVCHKTHKNDEALSYYEQALSEIQKMGEVKSAVALQNQLLNSIASVHVSTKQYNSAAGYLKQALDCQRNVESSIQGDFLGIMYQLGITYTLSGDVDKAIDSYTECLDIYDGLHGPTSSAMVWILCNLGTLYHVKACLFDDDSDSDSAGQLVEAENLLTKAEECYKQAVESDPTSNACIHYANFLYQQGRSAESLFAILPFLVSGTKQDRGSLVFNGVEQAVLPDCLQLETQDVDEFIVDALIFANLLAIHCYKHLSLIKDAEDCLVEICKLSTLSPSPLNFSLFGYALLEMNMIDDAAEAFFQAYFLEDNSRLPLANACTCLCLWVYTQIANGINAIWEYFYAPIYVVLPTKARYLTIVSRQSSRSFVSSSSHEDLESPDVQQSLRSASSILEAIRKRTADLADQEKGRFTGSSERISLLTTVREATSRENSKSPRLSPARKDNLDSCSSREIREWKEVESVDSPSYVVEYLVNEPFSSYNISGTDSHIEVQKVKNNEPDILCESSPGAGQMFFTNENLSVDAPEEILRLLESGALLSDYVTTTSSKGEVLAEDLEAGLHSEVTIEENFLEEPKVNNEDSTYDEDEDEAWVMNEEEVETPMEILRYLQRPAQEDHMTMSKSSVSSMSISDTEQYRSFAHDEEDNISPESVISNIRQQQQHRKRTPDDELNQNVESIACASYKERFFQPRETSRVITSCQAQEHHYVSTTRHSSHDNLNGNTGQYSGEKKRVHEEPSSPDREDWEYWSDEVVVDTPAEILQILKRQQQQQ